MITRFLSEPHGEETGALLEKLSALTPREREVVTLVALGKSNQEIAAELAVSTVTVKTHVNRAMAKLGTRDRAQLVIHAYEAGLVRPGWGTSQASP
ncbi:response regulator transcription factor [Streptomyces sp. Ncost-T10-10d]|uniref:response regulator transcription factor n=1 Tax=Streptomyces sp. Ncost-T10-10d TaxID=1839774 RepID=UPI00081DC7DE|nr:RNA polymerase sigma factor, sigma-70 family [Streptomyces sp. Ncost-T10-10d]